MQRHAVILLTETSSQAQSHNDVQEFKTNDELMTRQTISLMMKIKNINQREEVTDALIHELNLM